MDIQQLLSSCKYWYQSHPFDPMYLMPFTLDIETHYDPIETWTCCIIIVPFFNPIYHNTPLPQLTHLPTCYLRQDPLPAAPLPPTPTPAPPGHHHKGRNKLRFKLAHYRRPKCMPNSLKQARDCAEPCLSWAKKQTKNAVFAVRSTKEWEDACMRARGLELGSSRVEWQCACWPC